MLHLLLLIPILVAMAVVTLWRIPRLGLSVMNVIVFVGGALLGMIGFTRLVLQGIDTLFGQVAYEGVTGTPFVPFLISLTGAFLGGASFVALKMRAVDKLEEDK